MENKETLKLIAGLLGLIMIIMIIPIVCLTIKKAEQNIQFYNVLYHNGGENIEYYDVTELYYDKVGVYFKTQDGATVILNSGAIEIVPLDVD